MDAIKKFWERRREKKRGNLQGIGINFMMSQCGLKLK
jgi:hypothetical protein